MGTSLPHTCKLLSPLGSDCCNFKIKAAKNFRDFVELLRRGIHSLVNCPLKIFALC